MLTKYVPTVVSAACLLSNTCDIHGESFHESWASDDASSDIVQPDQCPTDSTAVSGSVAIREALVDYFDLLIVYYELHSDLIMACTHTHLHST